MGVETFVPVCSRHCHDWENAEYGKGKGGAEKNTEQDRHNMALFILVRVFRCMLMRSNDMFEMALTITFYLIWFFFALLLPLFSKILNTYLTCYLSCAFMLSNWFYFISKYETYICFRSNKKMIMVCFFFVGGMGLDLI